ncbi:hypothetical protein K3495_g7834 [Podosphaera aphanis]|nr:hypothetical protein K3495_g7834 [Podosphaera aphanis]
MGKNKTSRITSTATKKHARPAQKTRPSGITKPLSNAKNKQTKKSVQEQHLAPMIPFSPSENILLVGEGDLSFARSLVEHHNCTRLTATVFESELALSEKYPHVDENLRAIEAMQGVVRYNHDVTKPKLWAWAEDRSRGSGRMDRIIFNFPHVGGKSKDVNRQVRYNQELLVSFFKNAILSLSSAHGSSIIVTLFEGEPYTLWNIRDLARHSGLEVARSFKFDASVYPGYRHARTLGTVKNKFGEVGGGWRGEDRPARSFIFVRNGEGQVIGSKKKKVEESSDEEVGD